MTTVISEPPTSPPSPIGVAVDSATNERPVGGDVERDDEEDGDDDDDEKGTETVSAETVKEIEYASSPSVPSPPLPPPRLLIG